MSEDTPAWVGRQVRWARKRAGMTQHDLALAAGIPQPSIARIERGVVVPRSATLMAILAATGHRLSVEPAGPPVDTDAINRHRAFSVPRRILEGLGKRAADPVSGPIWIVRRLGWFGVPLVLIGDLAEVAHGRPGRVDRVIEICRASTDIASERLGAALEDLGATPEGSGEFSMDAGRLCPLTSTPAGDTYEVLRRNAVRLPIKAGLHVHVAAIDDLIRNRLVQNTPLDRRVAAELRVLSTEVGGTGTLRT